MEHYVTLFDELFLPQGLALHLSLERHAKPYTLWILSVDRQAAHLLEQLKLPNTRVLKLEDLELAELKEVKPTRNRAEYCWTLTPFTPRFVFEADLDAARVTYIDADVWFRKTPLPIFREYDQSGKHVLITEHSYAPEYDSSSTSGRFCVQFVTFDRAGGEPVRKTWEKQCLDWCYARYEDGKFGDQLYLDEWPDRFANDVHILQDKELILAPWNATRFPYGRAICWHFHGLRLVGEGGRANAVDCGEYPIPAPALKFVYKEYVRDLAVATQMIENVGGTVRPQATRTSTRAVKDWLLGFRSQWWRVSTRTQIPFR